MVLKDLDHVFSILTIGYLRYCIHEITGYTMLYVPYVEVYEQYSVRKEARDPPCEAGRAEETQRYEIKRSSQILNAS